MSDTQPGADAGAWDTTDATDAAGAAHAEAPAQLRLDRGFGLEIAALRARIKAGLANVRGLLSTASTGDHRATVAALSGVTNLLHEMLGPDSPPDSLRGALADLAAGRIDDARAALTAARTVLASGAGGVGGGETEQIDGTIGGALLALERGDRGACAMLAQTALDMLDAAD